MKQRYTVDIIQTVSYRKDGTPKVYDVVRRRPRVRALKLTEADIEEFLALISTGVDTKVAAKELAIAHTTACRETIKYAVKLYAEKLVLEN